MKHISVLFLYFTSFICIGENVNPLLGTWITDYERTILSIEDGRTAKKCFEMKYCGESKIIFTQNEMTTRHVSKGLDLGEITVLYEIKSINIDSIEIYLPESDFSFTYALDEHGFYYRVEEKGYTEYFILEK